MSRDGDAQLSSTIDPSAPIFVLRRSLGKFQHCVLAVARSAGRLGIPVYAVRVNDREPATRSRYIRDGLDLPAQAPGPEWIEQLLGLGAKHGRGILLPIDDLASVLVGDHQDRLAEHFLLPAQPSGVQRRLASKRELWQLCQELDLPTPSSTFPRSEQEVLEQADAHGYPVVVKRAEAWHPPRDPAAPSVAIARTREQLLDAYARMESPVQPQVMLQEYVPGDVDAGWMFNGYFGDGAECLCSFTGRKLRQRGPRTGPTTLGICATNDQVAQAATALMRKLDYRGIVDMGFRYDERDGLYKLVDVNPRLGSTFRLFVAENGIDVVRALHLDLTGRPVPLSTTRDGRKWIDEPGDLATSAQLTRERTLNFSSWRRSLAKLDEGAWWAADDPVPFMAMAVRFGPHAVRTLARSRAS